MFEKCDVCDFRDRPDVVCWAQAEGNPRNCELIAAGRADYRDDVRRRTLGEPTWQPPAMPPAPAPGPAPAPPLDEWEYVTTARLVADARALIGRLPPDVDAVVGIARSGLLPASLVAYHLHLPLWSVSRQAGVTAPGHGIRLECREPAPPRHVLLLDDTAAQGGEMAANAPAVRAAFPGARLTRAVVYCHPRARGAVDLWHALYPGSHYLEWNWANAGHGAQCAYDFDGILCRDFTLAECRDLPTYRAAMAAIPPLFLPRRLPVPLVVTARPESTRDLTTAWLARHGVRVERLVMWEGEPHPPPGDVAPWKALHLLRSDCVLFAESDPWQAREIAELSDLPVLCPALGRVVPGRPRPLPAATMAPVPCCGGSGAGVFG